MINLRKIIALSLCTSMLINSSTSVVSAAIGNIRSFSIASNTNNNDKSEQNKNSIIWISKDSIEVGTEFNTMNGVKAYDEDGSDITNSISVLGQVDNSKPGEYELEYCIKNKSGETIKRTRKVTVKENKNKAELSQETTNKDNEVLNNQENVQEVKIVGPTFTRTYLGEAFNDKANIQAIDSNGKDITSLITVEGQVDVNKVGSYELKYSVADETGKTATLTRKVNVINKNIFNKYIEKINEETKEKIKELGFSIYLDNNTSKFLVENQSKDQLDPSKKDKVVFKIRVIDKDNKEKLKIELLGSDTGESEKLNSLKELEYSFGDYIEINTEEAKERFTIEGEMSGDIKAKLEEGATATEQDKIEDYSDGVDNIDYLLNVRFKITEEGIETVYNEAPVITGVNPMNKLLTNRSEQLEGIQVTDDHDGVIPNKNILITEKKDDKNNVIGLSYEVADSWGRAISILRPLVKGNDEKIEENGIVVQDIKEETRSTTNTGTSGALKENVIKVNGLAYKSETNEAEASKRFEIKFDINNKKILIENRSNKLFDNKLQKEVYFELVLYDKFSSEKARLTINGNDKADTKKLDQFNGTSFEYGDQIHLYHYYSDTKLKIDGTILNLQNNANYSNGIPAEDIKVNRFELSDHGLKYLVNTAPQITGLDKIVTKRGEMPDLLNDVIVTDYEDGDIPKSRLEISDLDVNVLGEHTVTYKITDSWGTTTIKERIVEVTSESPLANTSINIKNKSGTQTAFSINFDDYTKRISIANKSDNKLDDGNDDTVFRLRIFSKAGLTKREVRLTGNDDGNSSKLNVLDGYTYTVGDSIELWSSTPEHSLIIDGEIEKDEQITEDYKNGITDIKFMKNVRFELKDSTLKAVYNNPPQIVFKENLTIKRGVDFAPLSFIQEVKDDHDTLNTSLVKTSYIKADMSIIGEHEITYTVSDKWGASTTVIKKIKVLPKNELEEVSIKLFSDETDNEGNKIAILRVYFDDIEKKLVRKILENKSIDGQLNTNVFTIRVFNKQGEKIAESNIKANEGLNSSTLSEVTGIKFEDGYSISIDAYDENEISIEGNIIETKKSESESTEEPETREEYNSQKLVKDKYKDGFTTDDIMKNTRFTLTEKGLKEVYNKAPEIIFPEEINVYKNSTFDLIAGVKVKDDHDGERDIKEEEVINRIDTSVVGIQSITYRVTDSWGRSTEKIRKVYVRPLVEKNTIELKNSNDQLAFKIGFDFKTRKVVITETKNVALNPESSEKEFEIALYNPDGTLAKKVEINGNNANYALELEKLKEVNLRVGTQIKLWSKTSSQLSIKGGVIKDSDEIREEYENGIANKDFMENVIFVGKEDGLHAKYNKAPIITFPQNNPTEGNNSDEFILYKGDDYREELLKEVTFDDGEGETIDSSTVKITLVKKGSSSDESNGSNSESENNPENGEGGSEEDNDSSDVSNGSQNGNNQESNGENSDSDSNTSQGPESNLERSTESESNDNLNNDDSSDQEEAEDIPPESGEGTEDEPAENPDENDKDNTDGTPEQNPSEEDNVLTPEKIKDLGEYEATYSVTDNWGRTTTEKRNIVVKSSIGRNEIVFSGYKGTSSTEGSTVNPLILYFDSIEKKIKIKSSNNEKFNTHADDGIIHSITIHRNGKSTIGPIQMNAQSRGDDAKYSVLNNVDFEYGDYIVFGGTQVFRTKINGPVRNPAEDYTDGAQLGEHFVNSKFYITEEGLKAEYTPAVKPPENSSVFEFIGSGGRIPMRIIFNYNNNTMQLSGTEMEYVYREVEHPEYDQVVFTLKWYKRSNPSTPVTITRKSNDRGLNKKADLSDYESSNNTSLLTSENFQVGDYFTFNAYSSTLLSFSGNKFYTSIKDETFSNGIKNAEYMNNVRFEIKEYNGQKYMEAVYNEAPKFTGVEDISIYEDEVSEFDPKKGVTVTDDHDTTPIEFTATSNNSVTTTIGKYVYTYTARDSWGRTTTVTRNVYVRPRIYKNRIMLYSKDDTTNLTEDKTDEIKPAFEIGFDNDTGKYFVANQLDKEINPNIEDNIAFKISIYGNNGELKHSLELKGNDRGTSDKLNALNQINYVNGDAIRVWSAEPKYLRITGPISGDLTTTEDENTPENKPSIPDSGEDNNDSENGGTEPPGDDSEQNPSNQPNNGEIGTPEGGGSSNPDNEENGESGDNDLDNDNPNSQPNEDSSNESSDEEVTVITEEGVTTPTKVRKENYNNGIDNDDYMNNVAFQANHSGLEVKYNEAPTFTNLGETKEVMFGEELNLKDGITVHDDRDNLDSENISISGEVNKDEIGIYPVTYTVTDKWGRSTSKDVEVLVVSKVKNNKIHVYDGNNNERFTITFNANNDNKIQVIENNKTSKEVLNSEENTSNLDQTFKIVVRNKDANIKAEATINLNEGIIINQFDALKDITLSNGDTIGIEHSDKSKVKITGNIRNKGENDFENSFPNNLEFRDVRFKVTNNGLELIKREEPNLEIVENVKVIRGNSNEVFQALQITYNNTDSFSGVDINVKDFNVLNLGTQNIKFVISDSWGKTFEQEATITVVERNNLEKNTIKLLNSSNRSELLHFEFDTLEHKIKPIKANTNTYNGTVDTLIELTVYDSEGITRSNLIVTPRNLNTTLNSIDYTNGDLLSISVYDSKKGLSITNLTDYQNGAPSNDRLENVRFKINEDGLEAIYNHAPNLTITGDLTLFRNESPDFLKDVKASDNDKHDSDVNTANIQIESDIDVTKIGEYTATYTLYDNWGRTTSATRKVIVKSSLGNNKIEYHNEGNDNPAITISIDNVNNKLKVEKHYESNSSRGIFGLFKSSKTNEEQDTNDSNTSGSENEVEQPSSPEDSNESQNPEEPNTPSEGDDSSDSQEPPSGSDGDSGSQAPDESESELPEQPDNQPSDDENQDGDEEEEDDPNKADPNDNRIFEVGLFDKDGTCKKKFTIEKTDTTETINQKIENFNDADFIYGDYISFYAKNNTTDIKVKGSVDKPSNINEDYSEGVKNRDYMNNVRFKINREGLLATYNEAPKMIIPEETVEVYLGDDFNVYDGVKVTDDIDIDMKSSQIKISEEDKEKLNKLGQEIEVNLTLTDSWGRSVKGTRKYTIINSIDRNEIIFSGYKGTTASDGGEVTPLTIGFSSKEKKIKIKQQTSDLFNTHADNGIIHSITIHRQNRDDIGPIEMNAKAHGTDSKFNVLNDLEFEYGDYIIFGGKQVFRTKINGPVRNGVEDYSDGAQLGEYFTNSKFIITEAGLEAKYTPSYNVTDKETVFEYVGDGGRIPLRIIFNYDNNTMRVSGEQVEYMYTEHSSQNRVIFTLKWHKSNGQVQTFTRMRNDKGPGNIQSSLNNQTFSNGDYFTFETENNINIRISGNTSYDLDDPDNDIYKEDDFSDGIDKQETLKQTKFYPNKDGNKKMKYVRIKPSQIIKADDIRVPQGKDLEELKEELKDVLIKHPEGATQVGDLRITGLDAVQTSAIGLYEISYEVTNSNGITTRVYRTINVYSEAMLALKNTNIPALEQGSISSEKDAIDEYLVSLVVASDAEDTQEEIDSKIKVTKTDLNPERPGMYSATYSVTNSFGQTATLEANNIPVVRTISVSVPTKIPFQVVTNLMPEDGDTAQDAFVSGVLKLKNNKTSDVQVYVKGFTKQANSGELEIVKPNDVDWNNLSVEDSMKKLALGIYAKSGLEKLEGPSNGEDSGSNGDTGDSGDTEEIPTPEEPETPSNPDGSDSAGGSDDSDQIESNESTRNSKKDTDGVLWLSEDNDINQYMGTILRAPSLTKSSEAQLSFKGKYGKNFIGGTSKGKFDLIFEFR